MRTRWGRLAVFAVTMAAVLAVPGVAQAAPTNVALNALARSSHLPCTLGSGPENAVDGAAGNINTDKWCVRSGQPTLTIPLTGSLTGYTVDHIVVKHAGAGGESPALNTRAFRLRGTTPSAPLGATLATVTANTANVTTHPIGISGVSQVQLLIDTPTQGTNQATRIYEVEVWGSPSPPPASGSGILAGNVVQIPVTAIVPIQVCNNNVAAGLIAVSIDVLGAKACI